MPAGAAVAGASLGLNYMASKKASKKAGNVANAAVMPWINLQDQQTSLYRSALGQLEGYGASAKNDILQNQKGLMAQTAQSAQNRGLYNTTFLDSANRGIAHSTNRSLASLNESLGQMKANLYLGLAGAKAQSAAGLSSARLNSPMPVASATNLFGPLQQLQSFQSGGGFGSLFGGGGGGGGYQYPGTLVGAPN